MLIVVVQLLSCVQLFVTPWTAACQASLSITNTQSLFKHISIESVIMKSTELVIMKWSIQPFHPLSSPFPPVPNLSQHQSLFQ